jgi:glycosyltransferase involved in cell wall biosynthesis
MIVRNEAEYLARCLGSVQNLVDHIVVADTGSTDETPDIAVAMGAQVVRFPWVNDFSAARNFALSCSKTEWNLILDADEYVVESDKDAVRAFMRSGHAIGRIQILSTIMSDDEVNESRHFITRLIPNGLRYEGRIHEQVVTDLPRVNVPIVARHTGYYQRNRDKAERNISLLLEELASVGDNAYLCYQLAKEYDGIRDDANSRLFYEKAIALLSGRERYAPNVIVNYLYLLIKLQEYEIGLNVIGQWYDWVQSFPDFHFACGIFYRELILHDPGRYASFLPLIESSYRRCIEIGETDRYDSVAGTGSYAAWYNLGNYYEVIGDRDKAIECYRHSASYQYQRALKRLQAIVSRSV